MINKVKVKHSGFIEVRHFSGSTIAEIIDAAIKSEHSFERTLAIATCRRLVASAYAKKSSTTNLLIVDELDIEDCQKIADRIRVKEPK
mgnify:CR=1 FL=1